MDMDISIDIHGKSVDMDMDMDMDMDGKFHIHGKPAYFVREDSCFVISIERTSLGTNEAWQSVDSSAVVLFDPRSFADLNTCCHQYRNGYVHVTVQHCRGRNRRGVARWTRQLLVLFNFVINSRSADVLHTTFTCAVCKFYGKQDCLLI